MQPTSAKRDDDRPQQEHWHNRHGRQNKGASPQVNSPNNPGANCRPQNNNNSNNRNNSSAKKDARENLQNPKQSSNNNTQSAANNNNNNPGSSSKSQQVTPKIASKTADSQPPSRGGKQDHIVDLFKTPITGKPNTPKQNSQLKHQLSTNEDSTPSRGGTSQAADDKRNLVVKKAQETPQSTEKDSPSLQRSANASNSKAEAERSQKKRYKALISEISPEMQAKLKENLVTITDKHDKLGFHCDPCSCNFVTLEEVYEHINSFWLHLYKKQLRKNPPPKVNLQTEHAQKLTEAIEEVFLENSAQESDYERWLKIATELQSRLSVQLETVRVEPAGLQGCHLAMKADTLNLCLSSSDGKPTQPARLLASLFQSPDLSSRCGLVFENSSSGDDNLRLIRCAKYTYSGESDPVPITLSVMCLDPTTKSLLDIYRQMLPEILPRLSIALQYWAKCVGFFEHNVLIPEALPVMAVHFLQHCHQPLLPILASVDSKPDPNFKTPASVSAGQLWVSMLHYFSFVFAYDKYAIDITSPRNNLALRDPEAKHSNRRRLFVNTAHQDVQQRFNLARLLKPDLMFDFFHDRIMCAFRYFSTFPENRTLASLSTVANLTEKIERIALSEGSDLCREVWVSQLVNGVVASSIDQAVNPSDELSDGICKELASKIVAEVISEALLTLAGEQQTLVAELTSPVPEKPFAFTRKVFLSNPTVVFPVACNYCGTTEHASSACKRILWTKPESLPSMTDSFMRKLDQAIQSVVKDMSNWPDWNKEIDGVVNDVMNAIKEQYPDSRLHLYGSCRNGFQVWPCDVDLCLTFNGMDSVPADQVENILVSIKRLLQKSRRFTMTIAVTSCRVPVVKFVHRGTELEGDICLYNQLALHNTKLLHTYSNLDERCHMLGLMAKHVFKQADICDASRGFLSSYAYILMVIFYLQHRAPPVLPCLQQMTIESADSKHDSGTPRVVDGWDTWFFEDTIEATRSAWSGFGLNKESIGSLWLGFLRFYTEHFDLANQVIAIRQLEPLLKLEKSIDTHVLAIEDPFNLSHNLGSGLRATAYAHIMKVFVKSRAHFGTPMETLPTGHKTWEKYILDPNQYSVADGPTGFQCHFCKCVGHTYARCERRLAALEEEKEEHQRLQRMRMEQQMQMQQQMMGAGASPRVVPYQRPIGPGVPRTAGLPNPPRAVDVETATGVPLPISALLSPNQQEQLEKMGVPGPSKPNGDPAVAQALAQLYPDLVGAGNKSSNQQQQSTTNPGQPRGNNSPTPLSGAFLSSMTSVLTPLLIDCHAHRQSLLSMNQVLTQLYAALTMLTNQLEQSNQQQQQSQSSGQQQQQMTQQLTVVVDQLRTGIGAFCGHVVQCCHHFDTQISSPVLQLASQVYQQQQVLATSPSSTTPNSNPPGVINNNGQSLPPNPSGASINQANANANSTTVRMHQQLQQLIAMQAAAAVNGPSPPSHGGLSFPQLQQWLQQNQNVPAPSLTAASASAPPRFPAGVGMYSDQSPPSSLPGGPNHPGGSNSWSAHSQQQPSSHPTLFGFPMNFTAASAQQTHPTQTAASSSTNSSTGGSESAVNHNPPVFPTPFPNALLGTAEKPQ